jgi:hypothetical protein
MMMIMEQLVEWGLAGETEVLGENLPQCYFVHHKSHMNPGRRGGKPATNRLSYGTALVSYLFHNMFLLSWAIIRWYVYKGLHVLKTMLPNTAVLVCMYSYLHFRLK